MTPRAKGQWICRDYPVGASMHHESNVGRGVVSAHSRPSDTLGNSYDQLDGAHAYAPWPNSGTALYASTRARGGASHQVSVAKPVVTDETTLSVIEIVNGGVVRDVKWTEVRAGRPLTSGPVTTTGPALLVSWWWGDADVRFDKTAVPNDGFTVIDAILSEGALVQCAVAVRNVTAAGTYSVTWSSTPPQGAQIWLAAIQSAGLG